jgi:hypothetical protein
LKPAGRDWRNSARWQLDVQDQPRTPEFDRGALPDQHPHDRVTVVPGPQRWPIRQRDTEPAELRLLTASAPAHVAKVRDLVIDDLSPAELRHLRTASERILQRIETSDQ